MSHSARDQLLIRVLDSLACAFGALVADPVNRVGEHVRSFGGAKICTLIGTGRSAPDRAALWIFRALPGLQIIALGHLG
jgi:2-methylcitrate dehydratase